MTDLVGSQNTLIASLIWGSIGFGFFVFGKKQQSMFPLFGGIFVMGCSYFIASAVYMSLVSVVGIAAIFFLKHWFD